MQRLSLPAIGRAHIQASLRACASCAAVFVSADPASAGRLKVAETMTPLAWWLLLIPAIFFALSVVIFVKYRGWRGFVFLRDAGDNPGSPFVEREFILSQYDSYKEYRVKMEEIIRLRGHVDASERRHDNILRDLIATRQFDVAREYLSAMIAHCKDVEDVDAEITYMTYLDKVKEFEQEAADSGVFEDD